jgi:hypothetical protein
MHSWRRLEATDENTPSEGYPTYFARPVISLCEKTLLSVEAETIFSPKGDGLFHDEPADQ